MQPSRSLINNVLQQHITEKELRDGVVYIMPSLQADETVTINRNKKTIEAGLTLLFVDLEPAANWSHACSYIFMDEEGNAREKFNGTFPPDQTKLRLFSKPSGVEDWMLLTTKEYDVD